MADSVERLSSGLRINRAKDDAAGLGISNSLTSQINSANQGIRNLNDGVSLVQTAEGAIAAASDMAQRILTLANQGANSTLGLNDRKSIRNEMNSLLSAIDSIGQRTTVSGNELLGVSTADDEELVKYSLQISANTNDVLNLKNGAFVNIGTGTAGSAVNETHTFTLPTDLAPGEHITIGGITVTYTGGSTASKANIAAVFVSGADDSVNDLAISTVNRESGWNITKNVANQVIFTAQTTGNKSDVTLGADASAEGVTRASSVQGSLAGVTGGRASTLSDKVSALSGLLDASPESDPMDVGDAFRDIQEAASNYVSALTSQRSLLGSYQNQIEFTASNVTELSANLSSARSRVLDTDYAAETGALTKGQILQQAATAMLAQANQMPNVILSLLK
jgi:flagellin